MAGMNGSRSEVIFGAAPSTTKEIFNLAPSLKLSDALCILYGVINYHPDDYWSGKTPDDIDPKRDYARSYFLTRYADLFEKYGGPDQDDDFLKKRNSKWSVPFHTLGLDDGSHLNVSLWGDTPYGEDAYIMLAPSDYHGSNNYWLTCHLSDTLPSSCRKFEIDGIKCVRLTTNITGSFIDAEQGRAVDVYQLRRIFDIAEYVMANGKTASQRLSEKRAGLQVDS
ncbi:MAG: hypothetical protein LBM73_01265 [Candidatus Nomurabacteria bacterium]|jgi:hypothetical protein|nr:hypothetical protein [Candidatus Nomurabacteria bacterium]